MNRISIIYLFFAFIILQGCAKSIERDNPLDGKTLPFISTVPSSNLTSTSVVTGGIIANDGGLPITSKGVIYSTAPNAPVQSAQKFEVGSGSSNYSSVLNSLSPATNYYYKSYATNLVGTAYGAEMSFRTSNDKPYVNTINPVSVSASNISIGGSVLSANGASILQKGIVLSTNVFNDTISSNIFAMSIVKYDSTNGSNINVNILNLKEATTYYVMAFARNSIGIKFGNTIVVKTLAKVPVIETTNVYDETSTSAKSGGQVIGDGGSPILSKGIVWSTNTNPTLESSTTFSSAGMGNESFISNIINLVPGKTYFVKAYARNAIGVGYGTQKEFKSIPIKPTIAPASFIAQYSSSVEVKSTIINDGGSPVLDFGFIYSTTPNPSLSNGKKVQYGNNTNNIPTNINFSTTIDGLSNGTKYYITSYVSTAVMTVYGIPEITYTTTSSIPKVASISSSNIGFNSAQISGQIVNNGGSTIVEKGFVIGTTSNVSYNSSVNLTITDLNYTDPNNILINVSNLNSGTLYYAKAYAKNSVGVGYGELITFTTKDSRPILANIIQSGITNNSIVLNGDITNTYNLPITEKGFIWSKTNTLTISNNSGRQNLGTGSASFSHTITNLEPGIIYFVKSYATNSAGTGYSNLSSFTTLSTTPSVTTYNSAIVSSSNATIKALISKDGGASITSAGFIVSAISYQAASSTNQYFIQNPSIGDISITRTGLTSGRYYFRAFAVNKNGRTEGAEHSFIVP